MVLTPFSNVHILIPFYRPVVIIIVVVMGITVESRSDINLASLAPPLFPLQTGRPKNAKTVLRTSPAACPARPSSAASPTSTAGTSTSRRTAAPRTRTTATGPGSGGSGTTRGGGEASGEREKSTTRVPTTSANRYQVSHGTSRKDSII